VGSRKKAKSHKKISEYTITEDDVDLVAERVQDHTMNEFEEAENQRGRIRNELDDIKQVLERIQAAQRQERGT
jgi:NACalpha-BTF3-like transcription factor